MFSRKSDDKERTDDGDKGRGEIEADTESLHDIFAVHTPQSTEELTERRPRGRHRLMEIDSDSGTTA